MQWEMQHMTSRQAGEVKTIPWRCLSHARRAGHPFQVTVVLSEWRIWNLTQSRWAWRQASPRNTKTVLYRNHSKVVCQWKQAWKMWNRRGKGKDEGRTVPSALVGFDQSRCSWQSRSEWSLRRQKAERSKPSSLTLIWNKQGRLLTQPNKKDLLPHCMFKDWAAKNIHFHVCKIEGKINSGITSVRVIINVATNIFWSFNSQRIN